MQTGTKDALDRNSTLTREYLAKTSIGEIKFLHLDDLLEFIQSEMLVAVGDTEIVVSLRRIEDKSNG